MKQAERDVLADAEIRQVHGSETHGDLHQIIREKKGDIESTRNSHTAWKLARALMELDQAYGQGDYDRACDLLTDIQKIKVFK